MTLKFAEELCVMTMKNDAKFEEELTCHFKTDLRNLTNFSSMFSSAHIFLRHDSCFKNHIMENFQVNHDQCDSNINVLLIQLLNYKYITD